MRTQTRRTAPFRLPGTFDPWLALALVVGAWARFSRVHDFDNQYYTAAVASMLRSVHNFAFGSFDPWGVVMVDKPPGALWVQALFALPFGVRTWSVNLPQALFGAMAPAILYFLLRREFGRVAAVAAAAVLVVVPASVVIDSRNEPDGVLYFVLLLAAACVIRAAETGRWRWVLAFGVLAGMAFNVKMLVAFVPLPAFLLYYALRTQVPTRRLVVRVAAAVAVVLTVSFAWVTFVALTPAADRPYVGSTPDNSVWTLTFKYNGLDRFTSFTRARPSQAQPGTPAAPQPPSATPQGQPSGATIGPLAGPAGVNAVAADRGVLALLANPLASQLGWLFPAAALMAAIALGAHLPERAFSHPFSLLTEFRTGRRGAQAILWVGWLATAAVVFGVANATTTHPYYLVGLAVPMAAVLGAGFAMLWNTFRRGHALAWVAPAALAGAAAYQAALAQGLVGDLSMALLLVVVLAACTIMSSALRRGLAHTPLAAGALACGAVALLVMPLVFGLGFGGRIAGAGPGLAGSVQPPPAGVERPREGAVSAFLLRQGGATGEFAIGTISAREAAPFILDGISAVAIGGFSGSDPIFTVASFDEMASRGDLRYFLMPGPEVPGGPPGQARQQSILSHVRATWRDVSTDAGLPRGSLYRR